MIFCVRHSHHPLHFLSTVLKCNVPTNVAPFWGGAVSGGGGGGGGKTANAANTTNQHYLVRRSRQSYRVRNWHVAEVQLRTALVRCPRRNQMQL